MGKAKADDNDEAREKHRGSDDDTGETLRADNDETDSDSADEITPVRPKIGESKDNLRNRSDYFQKRR